MKIALLVFAALVFCACASQPQPPHLEDPNLWLEEVEGEKPLEWVKERDKITEAELTSHPQYQSIEKDIRRIILAKDRLPTGGYSQGYVYNFWQDDVNVRGLYRRATLAEFKKAIVKWEIVVDLDQLAKKENENWVWRGLNCLPPEMKRCLMSLSRGGKDAVVVREFDQDTHSFVKNGFNLPEAKTNITWISPDKVFVATDFGPGSITKSGYPRQVKAWSRGTPLQAAKLVIEANVDELAVDGSTFIEPAKKWHFVSKSIDFYRSKTWLYSEDGKLTELPIPEDAVTHGVHEGNLLFTLKTDFKVGEKTFKAGSLVSINLANLSAPAELVYEPRDRASIQSVEFTKHSVMLGVLENVQDQVYRVQHENNSWQVARLQSQDRETFKEGNLIVNSGSPLEEIFMAKHEGFLSPPSIVIGEDSGKGVYLYKVKTSPARFDSSRFLTEQLEATSKDGTKIPYFVIRPKDAKFDGNNPTVLYGYGGFMIPMQPYYLNATGKIWLEKENGIYVIANIRGGGEFGPAWHEAAVKEKRQTAFDDFIAVAEDLIARGITSKKKLAIMGGSNGGLLVGATMVERPELFKAVVCQVPLLDMLRYHTLLAGHSWIAEYGNPEVPAEREALLKYSPYQNLQPNRDYPMTLFMTSTRDDRVHPGHARKMMAKMMEYGKPALYWENTEGGHAGAANLEQRVKFSALQWTFLTEQLVGPGAAPQK